MEVRIGVTYTAKELLLEMDGTPDDVKSSVDEAFVGATSNILWLTDAKGRRVAIPTDKVAYVEVTTEDSGRKVGFGR